MKKLSFILAMIIALSGMIGLFAAPVYAADADTVELTVGATGCDYTSISDALGNCTSTDFNYVIDIQDAALTETTNETIKVNANVTVKSSVGTPTITYNGTEIWIKTTGGKLTFSGLTINYALAKRLLTPGAGSTLRIENCTITGTLENTTSTNSIIYCAGTDTGKIEIHGSTLSNYTRIILLGAAGGDHTYNIDISSSTLTSTRSNTIQSNAKDAARDKINISITDGSSIITNYSEEVSPISLGQYEVNANFINSKFTATKYYVLNFSKNDAASILNANIINCTLDFVNATSYSRSGIYSASGNGVVNVARTTFNMNKNVCIKTTAPSENTTLNDNEEVIATGNGINFNLTGCSYNHTNANRFSIASSAEIPSTLVEYESNNTLIQMVGAQLSSDTDDTTASIRFVYKIKATEDELEDYSKLGLHITLNNCAYSFNPVTTTVVYTSIKADNITKTAESGYYYVLAEVKNIPSTSYGTNIYVRPYIINTDGATGFIGEAAYTSVNSVLSSAS